MKVGDLVKIIEMKDEPQYYGKTGRITHIDDACQIHGTWGGCAIIPEVDTFEIAQKCCICGKEFFGYGNNPWPLKPNGKCCDKCNIMVIKTRLIERK